MRQCSYASPREAMGWLAYNAARGPSLVTVVVFIIPAMVLLAEEEENTSGRVWGGTVRSTSLVAVNSIFTQVLTAVSTPLVGALTDYTVRLCVPVYRILALSLLLFSTFRD